MTAYFDASRTARDDRQARNSTPPVEHSPTPDLRRFQDAVDALKAELERSGRPDRFVMEKMEQIEQFAESIGTTLVTTDGEAASGNRLPVDGIDRAIEDSQSLDELLRRLCQELRLQLSADRVAIYRFNFDWTGEFITESMAPGWMALVGNTFRDTYFESTQGNRYNTKDVYQCEDIYRGGLSACHVQLIERFQGRAYMIAPVFQGDRLWGLLAIYQNSGPRPWSPLEAELVKYASEQVSRSIAQLSAIEKLQKQVGRQRAIATIVDKIHQFLDLATIMQTTTDELRILLECDRAAVYRFSDDWSGDFVSESVGRGWKPLLGKTFRDSYFERTKGGRYINGETLTVADIQTQDYDPCHLKLLEQFQCRAYIIAPVIASDKLWGLLAVYQNDRVRSWEPEETDLVTQMGQQMGVAVQQAEYLKQLQDQKLQLERNVQQDRALLTVMNKIRESLDIDNLFATTTQEIRQIFQADRACIFRFDPDWSGEFVAEAVTPGWQRLLDRDGAGLRDGNNRRGGRSLARVEDSYLQDNQGGRYRQGETLLVNDIYQANFSRCYLDLLEQFQAKAYAIAPIFKGNDLWGLLAVYQNSNSRQWEELEGQILSRLGTQLGLALQQAEYVEQLKTQAAQLQKSAERNKAISATIDKIRASLDIRTIFRTTTTELRQILEVDRVGIYQFQPDWSGQFMAESVGPGWLRLLDSPDSDGSFQTEMSDCEAINGLTQARPTNAGRVRDTYLQENEGGRYARGESFVVSDIYKAGFTPCYLSVLERFQARAYAITPIFQGDRLWGLLAIYQNSGPRQWETSEVEFVAQVGAQLGIALKQAETLAELQRKSAQVEEAAQRDKAAREALQQKALNLLMAVRPALEGDLTVRAPITEDEVGTIADAYNNTLQSLRQIVVKLQETAAKVSNTSTTSSSAIGELSNQAQQQYRALLEAVQRVQTMAEVSTDVTQNAQQVTLAVQRATNTIQEGDAAMNRTVDAILSIRDTVAETGRKIRALSESSQKISKIVSLIGNFTTQTQLLALNAAIEATRAGEYGRGFTVVADEVRSLARQSADATTEIAALVEEIQAETQAVAQAMEAGIQQVVAGTNLVSDTRSNLSEIVDVTAQIGQLVEGINQAAASQTQQAQAVAHTMTEVATIADRTSSSSVALTASFEDLLAMSQELQASVGRFKVN
ncbi:MAG: GAF domain-containing protein [Limnothrix sp. BL-A-16]